LDLALGWLGRASFLMERQRRRPSSGKSPATDQILGIIRSIEHTAVGEFADVYREWEESVASAKAHRKHWEKASEKAIKDGTPPPPMPKAAKEPSEPHCPRIMTSDTTIEELASIEAKQPKGFMVLRDELAGWYASLGRYTKGNTDRIYYVEGYGGRMFRLDRVRFGGAPIKIARHGIGIHGGIVPDRLAEMLASPDDGLTSRFLWAWPNKVRVTGRPSEVADANAARIALRLLWDLPLVSAVDHDGTEELRPYYCYLSREAGGVFETWWVNHQNSDHVGPLAQARGKMPGQVLRLAIVLEHLWWAGAAAKSSEPILPPSVISEIAIHAGIALSVEYFEPMAQRCYGDAAIPEADKLATVLARYIIDHRKLETINARTTRREAGLPGLRTAEKMTLAIESLVDAGWLVPAPRRADGPGRRAADYRVNPRLRSV
jgi:hypothetical protein